MLKNILTGNECAACRICCVFDKYDLWETPVISRQLKETIQEKYPQQQFIKKDEGYLLRMSEDENGLYYCPMLDKEKGCVLADGKPFDCSIWPYRIMSLGGRRVISIASVCPSLYDKPLSELVNELVKNGLAEKILGYAAKNPGIIKEYQKGYPVLFVE